jgi:ribosomal-protein-alanine N-acetyltransferase
MRADDKAAVLAIEGVAFAAASRKAEAARAQLDEEFARPWAHLWVVRHPEVVAFLLAWVVADEMHVLNVATAPEKRRRGYARLLIAHALAHCRKSGLLLVVLEVRIGNRPAIALYKQFGFFALGVRRAYYDDGEDALEMALRLDPTSGAVVPEADCVRLDLSGDGVDGGGSRE